MMFLHIRATSIVGVTTFCCAAAVCGLGPPAAAASGYVNGSIKVAVSLTTNTLPAGTVITLNAGINPDDPTYFASAYIYSSAKVAAGKVTATVVLPYKWYLGNTAGKMSVNVSAYGTAATTGLNNSSSLSKDFVIPANGTVTSIAFTGTI